MELFQTIFVYTAVLFFMFFLGHIAVMRDYSASISGKHVSNFFRIEILLLLLVFSVIFGMRYDVGQDHLYYLSDYLSLSVDRYEPIFKNITILLRENNIHYSVYFFLWAFIQVFFLYYTFKNEKFLYPYIAFVLFAGQYFMAWMNTIRQDIAGCIFLFSTIYIFRKKPMYYLLCCIMALGFHNSAVLLIPFYWILYRNYDFFNSKLLQYSITLFCSFVALSKVDYTQYITPVVDFFLSSFSTYSTYSLYSIEYFAELTKAGGGISIICQILIDFVIIMYSSKLKAEFADKRIIIFYNLYFFGTSIQTLFINNLLFSRPFRCFRIFKLVISAYLLYYLCTHLNSKNLFYLIILLLLHTILFMAQIKYVPFTFYWQV